MNKQVRNAYRHLGLPQALSLANVLVMFALQMAGSTLASMIDYSERPFEFFAIRFLSICVFALVVWIGRLTLNRFGTERPLPLVTLLTFVVALVLNAIVFDAFLVSAGFTDQYDVERRIMTSALGVLVSQILTSLLVTYSVEFSQNNALLSRVQDELLTTRAEATQRISDRKAQLIQNIRKEITEQLDGVGVSSRDKLAQMQSLIDDVVRPISYSLLYDVEAEPDPLNKVGTQKVDWKTVLRSSLFHNPFRWIALPALIGAISALFLITAFQLRGLLTVGAILLVFGFSTFVANKLWSLIPQSIGVLVRGTLFSLYYVVLAWISLLLISELTNSDFIDQYRLPAWLVITNLAAWTVSLVSEVNTMLRSTNLNLRESIADLKREVVALNSSYRQLQRDVSRVLHGPIQQAIHATLMRFKTNPEVSVRENLASDLRSRISQALDSLNSTEATGENLVQVLTNLQALWSDNVDIQFTVDKLVEKELNSHPATALSVSELVQEATSNAIRHGEAREVYIEVEITEDQRNLAITVSNNGLPVSAEAKAGLGTQLFEDLTIEWSRIERDGAVIVYARLPIN